MRQAAIKDMKRKRVGVGTVWSFGLTLPSLSSFSFSGDGPVR
jgi:hypothetical protein